MSKKLKFFYSHLAVSLSLAVLSMILVFCVWYQYPLNTAAGVNDVFLMMLAIDVLIGPILALIVYKEGKKSLKFDLTFIVVLQASAYLYGMYSVFSARPVFIAYTLDRFEVVCITDLNERMLQDIHPDFEKLSMLKPKYINAQIPQDANAQADIMLAETLGVSIAFMPSTYNDITTAYDDMSKHAINLSELSKYNTNYQSILDKYPAANQYLPLKAKNQNMTVLIDTKKPAKPEIVAIVDLRPWN